MFEFNVITVLPLRTFAVIACPSAILMQCFSDRVHCSEKGIKSGVFVSFAVAEQPVPGGGSSVASSASNNNKYQRLICDMSFTQA